MKKVLLIGNGAREHAVAEALKNSKTELELSCFGSAVNPGIKKLAANYQTGSLKDFAAISEFAKTINPDFAFIGPDDPIGLGLADYLESHNDLASVAPKKVCAQLEASKAFTRELMRKYDLPGLPKFKVFTEEAGIENFITNDLSGEYVIKYDGLLGGKGVKLSGEHLATIADGLAYAKECIAECGRVVIEEKWVGQEFSLLALSDGHSLYHFPVIQDHKRAFDGDNGPNTGGMGTCSDADHSLPFLSDADITAAKEINEKIIKAVHKETGVLFKGVLYGGFIATKSGVGLIEYNVRFGDPEAMNALNLLEADFLELCESVLDETLDAHQPKFKDQASVCIYAVPEGYPTDPKRGANVTISKEAIEAKVYFASVDLVEETDQELTLKMSGSRAIAFVGLADTIELARRKALAGLKLLSGPVVNRTDIGSNEVLDKKCKQMQELRGS